MWGTTKALRFLHTSRICWTQNQKSALAQLRKKTGYTIANCKKALELHQNDIVKVVIDTRPGWYGFVIVGFILG